jgi:hypothetical protein
VKSRSPASCRLSATARLCHAGGSLLDVRGRCRRGYEENQLGWTSSWLDATLTGATVIDFADRTKLGFNCDVVVAFDVARPDARSLTRSAL